ncbi:ribonuclease Z [Alkalibacillus flavidus]|uniref:Ribonuclease Z n=1 Tax=Alkalibacillus flavidus TaxID=546021 RepID=A0ABV2KS49_9BACI
MELTFLGTGSGVPSKSRNVSSLALQMHQERDEIWLFDCGEATQHQILKTTIKPRKITKIFITHLHGDHIFGLPGLLSSRSFQDGTTPLEIYGPNGIQTFVETALSLSQTHLKYPIQYYDLQDGTIFQDDTIKVDTMQVIHGVPSYGFTIQEADKTGHLLPEKLKAFGIQPGPLYERIKREERITLQDGTVIERDQVTGPTIFGRKLAIIGDTLPFDNVSDFVKDADVLIHEATFIDADESLANQYNHSTSVQAAQIARDANVKQLWLNHISSRYVPQDLKHELSKLTSIHPSVRYVSDFDSIPVEKVVE